MEFHTGETTGLTGFPNVTITTSVTPGIPHHVVATRDSAGTIKLYLDGMLRATASAVNANTNSGAPFVLGAWDDRFGVIEFFSGLIDEVAVYNVALPAERILGHFNAAVSINVAIDVKPGSFPSSVNPRSRGIIPVAILTTSLFDATSVDPNTVLFGKTGYETAPVHFAFDDVDLDGHIDMILHFNTQATGIQCGDTTASLTGKTFGGQAIEGFDYIKTVGCK